MAGTKAGAKRAVATNQKNNPNYYSDLAKKAGSAKVAKGYSMMTPEQRAEQGHKGGTTRWNKTKNS